MPSAGWSRPAAGAATASALVASALVLGCVPADAGPDGDGAPVATAARAGATGEGGPGGALDLADYRLVDLSHGFGEETVYWPTATTGFELDELAYGQSEGGWFYSAYALATPEHGGTHLDAPMHFWDGGLDAASIPLERLVGGATVIDIADRAAADPDYRLTVEDVEADEAAHGPIPEGSLVLLRTGWSARWPDAAAYLGDDTPGDASNLHFPSFGPEAARLLIEGRGAVALGADVASIDPGDSQDFPVHRIAGSAGVPGLENLTNLDDLPARGAIIVALPMKIEGGSGGPLRAIALVPR